MKFFNSKIMLNFHIFGSRHKFNNKTNYFLIVFSYFKFILNAYTSDSWENKTS